MYLSKLEIQGFKSFAEKAVLEFNKELTAIVGPNGSGKSNIADAVRWVLGEQSLKLLRGKKSEDVIFSGSKKKSRLGFAEVSLYLNNADGKAPLDYREIVITRRIYRDGEGEYLINKNKVRLTDIQLLLAKASFGQKNYSIIGQGMVDSILTSSPQERKDFFDEATGVREYQIKKEQAGLKLEHSHHNLIQSEQLMEEIEPRLRSLTRQVKRLERKEETEKKLIELSTLYYSRLWQDLKIQEEDVLKKLAGLENEKNLLEQKIQNQQKTIDELQAADTQARSFQKLQDEYQNLTSERHRLSQELSLIESKINLDLTKLGKVDLVWLNGKKTEIKNQLTKTNQEVEETEGEIEKLEQEFKEKTAAQTKRLAEFSALEERLNKKEHQLTGQDSAALNKIKHHLNELYQKQADFVELLAKAKETADWEKLKGKAAGLLEEIKWLIGKIDELAPEETANLADWQTKLNEFLKTKDLLVNEIHELEIKLEVAKEKNENFKEERAELEAEAKKISAEFLVYQSPKMASGALLEQKANAQASLKAVDEALEKLKKELDQFSLLQAKEKNQLIQASRHLKDWQLEQSRENAQINQLKIELAKIETKKENLEKEIAANFKSDFKPLEKIPEFSLSETEAEIGRLKNQLMVIGGIDEEVATEYEEVKTRYDFLSEQSADLKKAIASCEQLIDELDEKISEQFETAFKKINEKFDHYFKILFNGGQAKLILEKREVKEELPLPETNGQTPELPPEEEIEKPLKKKQYEFGIEIQATPPGKRLKSLNMLSGGEKALTSIALISAIIANNPSPFVILDEVDAALDEANSIRFAKIVEELSDRTQFICITHNRATMHQAAILYGVTMSDNGVSKLLSINLTEAEKVAESS